MLTLAIIGFGNMGSDHAMHIMDGKIDGVKLTAIGDNNPDQLAKAYSLYGDRLKYFHDINHLFASKQFDAVLIATPHYDHPHLVIKALKSGYHVLCEKPIGVDTKAVRELNEIASKHKYKFGIMYNQRTNPLYQKIKHMIDSKKLGEIRRSNWIITNWYRTQAYYDSNSWRATWNGEGGGVLLNQAPHQLDLWQWFCGMPQRIRGFCYFGKRRNIEVEDDVTIYAEYANGASGVFIASTTDCPGSNRLEITGSLGKIVVENDRLHHWYLDIPEQEYNRQTNDQNFGNSGVFSTPEVHYQELSITDNQEDSDISEHCRLISNWAKAVCDDTPMLAAGVEAINGLMISNAAYLSTFIDDWVNLPIDEELFLQEFNKIRAKSKY